MRGVENGGVGALAAVASVSCGRKMANNRACLFCPSFHKVSYSYFLVILLNKLGAWVPWARGEVFFERFPDF